MKKSIQKYAMTAYQQPREVILKSDNKQLQLCVLQCFRVLIQAITVTLSSFLPCWLLINCYEYLEGGTLFVFGYDKNS